MYIRKRAQRFYKDNRKRIETISKFGTFQLYRTVPLCLHHVSLEIAETDWKDRNNKNRNDVKKLTT